MARKLRIHYEGALYHVICRGNNRAFVFEEDETPLGVRHPKYRDPSTEQMGQARN